MSNIKIKRRSFAETFQVKEEPMHIWAVNSSDLRGTQPRGLFLIEYPTSGGAQAADTIMLMPTWLPVDLLEFTGFANLKESQQLQSAVRKGVVTLIDDDSARQLLARPEAATERARVAPMAAELRNTTSSTSQGGDELELNLGSVGPSLPTAPSQSSNLTANVDSATADIAWAEARIHEMNEAVNKGTLEAFAKQLIVTATVTQLESFITMMAKPDHPIMAYVERALSAKMEGESLTEQEVIDATNEFNARMAAMA